MTCIEMFLHVDYYCKHPLFLSTFSNHRECFSSVNNILKACVSDASINMDLVSENLVQHEAISNCNAKSWSSFLCILALSSVIGRNIHSVYPDFGLLKEKLLFNQVVTPRSISTSSDIFVLFCREGNLSTTGHFVPNHFVPLVLADNLMSKEKREQLNYLVVLLLCRKNA